MADPLTWAAVGAGTSLLGGLFSAQGAAQTGAAGQAQAQYQAGLALQNAQINKQNADYTRRAGGTAEIQEGLKIGQTLGQQKVAQGASGVDVNSGSPSQVRDSTIMLGQMDQSLIEQNYARKAYGYEVEAATKTSEAGADVIAGTNIKKAADINVEASILGTVGSVSSKWLQASSAFTKFGTSQGITTYDQNHEPDRMASLMAQVPYSGVPDQTLQPIATPEMNPRINQAAFGGDIAAATSGLGHVAAHAGDEIFQRAVALKNLDNESEAKEAAAQYQIKAGELHAQYSSLQGQDAVNGYKKYASDLNALRHQMRDGLSTTMAQKQFDSDSLSTMGRTIFNGAGHAATQQKAYVIGASSARIGAAQEGVFQSPDPATREAGMRVIQKEARFQAAAKGASPEETEELVKAQKSQVVTAYIRGVAMKEPFKAGQLLGQAKEAGTISPDDYARVENVVRAQSRAVGSANIAQEVYKDGQGDDNTPAKSLSQMESEAREKARAQDPDDPILEKHAVDALRGVYNQEKYAKRQEDVANQQTVQSAILSTGATTEQQLRTDPTIAAAIDASPKSFRLSLPSTINNYHSAAEKVANEGRFNTLMGMKNNDVEGFLSINPFDDKHMNQSQMKQIDNEQRKIKKDQSQDPRVDRAMGWMRAGFGPQMEALGAFRRTKDNKENYDHLTGTVQQALDVWQENKGKPPTYKEFNEQIAPQILQQSTRPGTFGMLFGGVKKPMYDIDTSTKDFKNFSEKVKSDIVGKGGTEPTDEELYKAYTRTQLMKLYPQAQKPNE